MDCYNAPMDDFYEELFNLDYNNSGKKLRVEGLYNKEYYTTDFYSFKTGDYMITDDCQKSTGANGQHPGSIDVKHPKLWVIGADIANGHPETPLVWFVTKLDNCGNKSPILNAQNSDEVPLKDKQLSIEVEPNPSSGQITIKSSEIIGETILYSVEGKEISRGNISVREHVLFLSKGTYYLRIPSHSCTKKLIVI